MVKRHFRHLFSYHFSSLIKRKQPLNITETYPDSAPSVKTCEYLFRRFKNDDFNLEDEERPRQPKKFEDELQEILDQTPARTLKKLAGLLDANQNVVSKRLKTMGKIQKKGK